MNRRDMLKGVAAGSVVVAGPGRVVAGPTQEASVPHPYAGDVAAVRAYARQLQHYGDEIGGTAAPFASHPISVYRRRSTGRKETPATQALASLQQQIQDVRDRPTQRNRVYEHIQNVLQLAFDQDFQTLGVPALRVVRLPRSKQYRAQRNMSSKQVCDLDEVDSVILGDMLAHAYADVLSTTVAEIDQCLRGHQRLDFCIVGAFYAECTITSTMLELYGHANICGSASGEYQLPEQVRPSTLFDGSRQWPDAARAIADSRELAKKLKLV